MAAATANSKKLTRTDQCRWTRYAVRFTDTAIQPVGQAGIEIDLNDDGHGEHDDDERLLDDGFALKGEQQYQREQQRGDGMGGFSASVIRGCF